MVISSYNDQCKQTTDLVLAIGNLLVEEPCWVPENAALQWPVVVQDWWNQVEMAKMCIWV